MTGLRERARAAYETEQREITARHAAEQAREGAILAGMLREYHDIVIPSLAIPVVDIDGIRFGLRLREGAARFDPSSYDIHAALILPSDEYGTKTSHFVTANTLAALGTLIATLEALGALNAEHEDEYSATNAAF
jgi:hypothetical protein